MLRHAIALLTLSAVSFGLVVALAEGVLRAAPGLIGREVLLEFDDALRSRVAARIGLPLKQARLCLGPEERADGGPDLCLIPPDMKYRLDADPEDRALGAVELLPHDGRGFCNPPAVAARPRAEVVAVGDSFTWCTAVAPERTWPAVLETQTGLSVYNLGVPGVGLHEYIEVLIRFGLALEPQVVVVGVYGGNDLRDAARFAAHHERRGTDEPLGTDTGPIAVLLRNSYAVNFISGSAEVLTQRWRRPGIDFSFDVEHGGRWSPMNRGGADLDEVRTARALLKGDLDPIVWNAPLARLADLAGERGFRVVLAYLPSAHAAYAPAVRFSDATVGAAVTALDEAQRRAISDLAGRQGMAFIDCTESLHAAVRATGLAYFPGNLHLTPAGHALVAACVKPMVAAVIGTGAMHR